MSRRTRSLAGLMFGLVVAACSGEDVAPYYPPPTGPVPYATQGDRLGYWNGSEYQPVFIKGINLGVAVPGTLAGELAATREQYDHWFEQMGRAGINAIRVYTLHYPRFYDAVAAYNRKHGDKPLYVLHGMWLDEENPSQDLYDMTDLFSNGIREVIDCVHGNRVIGERKGRAFGTYTADISRWVMAYIIGREVYPDEVSVTNAAHAGDTSYSGAAISLPSGTPTEAWFTEHLDLVVTYEREHYGNERPVSVSSWPTLDPLRHPSEVPSSTEDLEQIDFENIDTSGAPGGYFASYHAYPYYPDFMTRDPDYQNIDDRAGPNPYFGYLMALKAHYVKHPLLIAEFGVPTSWGNAHFGAGGMDHGGENEAEQGQMAVRLLENMLDANCAGGAFFAWIDEWWKRTWIVDELTYPRDRYRLWHNLTSPEQNFGFIAFDAGQPEFKRFPAVTGRASIRELRADVDHEFFHVRLKLAAAPAAGQTITVGFDTYGDDVGESLLPDGHPSAHRDEIAFVWHVGEPAQLYVTTPYDLFGIWHHVSEPQQLFHSVASDAGDWVTVRWLNNVRDDDDGNPASEIDEVGRMEVIGLDQALDRRYGLIVDRDTVYLRIPWTLLQFADPSTRTVIDDDRSTTTRETQVSDGIALTAWLGDEQLQAGRARWQGWNDAPHTDERTKISLGLFADGLRGLP